MKSLAISGVLGLVFTVGLPMAIAGPDTSATADNPAVAAGAAAPLSATQRIERDRYLAQRLGLGFGVPPQARAQAIVQMRGMASVKSGNANASSTKPKP